MKKFLSILVIAGAMTACNGGGGEAAKADSAVTKAADTAKAIVDSAAAKADSTIKAVADTAKAKIGGAVDSAKKAAK